MKRIILALFIWGFEILNAQSTYTDLPGKWRLGFNMGGIWESSDVKPIPGLGGGFTLEKILNKRSDAFLGFSLGFRYLGGRTYGLNTSPTGDLANNKALNGTYNPAIRYDTVQGGFYANHKTYIQEGALELKMNFPNFEKRTGIIFHLWGGIGIGKYKTWIDALDKDGKMYDFSSLKGQSVSQSDLSRIFDKSYETLAQGSGTNGTLCFIPSLGIGLGYRLSKGVAIVFEHKISFPGTNLLDGIEYPKNCPITGANDFYNYTSVGLVFTFYGGHTSSSTTSTNTNNGNIYTNTTNTQTVVTNNNTGYTNNTAPVVYPPTVVITYPANNFLSPYDYTTVNASLQHVANAQQISISQNGYPITHFTYNYYNGDLHFQTFLAQGVNNFVIAATNQGGTASQGVSIIYNPLVVPTNTVITTQTVTTTNTNTVVLTNTVVPTNTIVATGTVIPTHTTTTVNTNTIIATGTVVATHTTTTAPTNTIIATGTVVATHTATTAATNTVQTQGSTTGRKPVVTFINPSSYPMDELNATYEVNASVANVSNGTQVNVTVNGSNFTQFTFNAATKILNFTINLQQGYNTISITGTNSSGTDTKSAIINHKPLGRPPLIVIADPAASPFTSSQSMVIISGFVYNVNSSADINVTANGSPNTFSYNINTHAISITVNLMVKTTQVNISATNSFGNNTNNQTLYFLSNVISSNTDTTNNNTSGGSSTSSGINHPTKPEITVTSPVIDPYYTNTGVVSVSANVSYVFDQNNLSVNYNGAQVSFSYDMNNKHLSFSSPLKPGLNTFVISATNTRGIVTKSVNVNYTPVILNSNANNGTNNNNTNTTEPTYNHGGWNMSGIFNSSGGNNNSGNTNNGGNNTPRTFGGGNNNTPPPNNGNPVNVTPQNNQAPPRTINKGGGNQTPPIDGGGIKTRPR